MSFSAYPEYRESGVEWIGQVPAHWTVAGLKRCFTITGGSTPKSDVEDYWGGDIAWITPGDLSKLNTKFIAGSARSITSSGMASCATTLSPAGSIVVSTRAPIGSLAITEVSATTNQGCKTLVPIDGGNAVFTFYALSIATEQLNVRGKGSTFLEISADDLGAFTLPFPPAAEQLAISAFLDRETTKIDKLIEEQRCLIALLKEKRQAVISHAVTKGLDPHTSMKDSGIEWLGEVPAHWQLLPLRRVVRKFVDYRGATPNKVNEGVPLITATQIKSGRIDHSLDPVFISEEEYSERMTRGFPAIGDLLLTTEAPLGEVALVDVERVAPGQRIILMKTADHMSSSYLHAHFRSDFGQSELWTRSSGSTASGIRADRLRSSAVLVPPLDEQREIVEHIRQQTAAFDYVFEVVNAGMDLLRERRAALISAAVTGKIDVRPTAHVLPFPIDRIRARGLVATEIIERLARQQTFHRVKLQKIAFLADVHLGISELAGCYTREAAGPLDRQMRDEMERGAHSIAGIVTDQAGGAGSTVVYRLARHPGAHRQELAGWLGPKRNDRLDKLIDDFADLDTHGVEAVATLYAVWNDALIDGAEPTDDEIISGFLNDWHPEKRKKFRAADLPEWLGWMRRHDIVPTGTGPRTTTGRLFV